MTGLQVTPENDAAATLREIRERETWINDGGWAVASIELDLVSSL